MRLVRSVATLALILSFGTAGIAECAGWAASPETRMDCCEDGLCPMHAAEPAHSAHRATTQAQADSCCAVSAPGHSAPPAAAATVVPVPAATPLALIEPLAERVIVLDARRAHAPLPGRHVPTHVLLSVFLI